MNSRIHFLLTLSPSQVPLRYNLSSNSLYLHTLPTSKLHQQNRFFFVGPWSRHSCLQGQAFIRWMWDFSECVIVSLSLSLSTRRRTAVALADGPRQTLQSQTEAPRR